MKTALLLAFFLVLSADAFAGGKPRKDVDSWGYPKLPNDTVCNGYGCYKPSYVDNGYRYKTPVYRDQYGTYYIGNDSRVKRQITDNYRRGVSDVQVYPGTTVRRPRPAAQYGIYRTDLYSE